MIREAKKKDSDDTVDQTTDTIDAIKTQDILGKKDSPVSKTDATDKSDKKDKKLDLKTASQADSLRAAAEMTPTDRMQDLVFKMKNIEDSDGTDVGYEIKPPGTELSVTVDNLPAVVGKDLESAGVVRPTFHKVSNLPGNMRNAIRRMGKILFKSFTRTSTDDVYVIADLMGMGPNSRREVNAVAGYLRENGEDIGMGDVDFNDIMPGYVADTYQYRANGARWLLVRDEFGEYIYVWPEEDSVQHSMPKALPGRGEV